MRLGGWPTPEQIDRVAVVRQNNPRLERVDPRSPLSVGNGELAFTADLTGLQTFLEAYDLPLATQAQWGGVHIQPLLPSVSNTC